MAIGYTPVSTLAMPFVAMMRQDTLESLEIDISKSADFNYNWAVTSHPVERGAEISDHTQRLPSEMQIVGILTGLDTGREGTSGNSGTLKYQAFRDWMVSASTVLWTVVIPNRFTLSDCLITALRITMTMDDFIEVTIGVREVRLVDSRTTAGLISTGGGGGGRSSNSVKGDLDAEAQDGVQETRSGLLWNTRESIISGLQAINPF